MWTVDTRLKRSGGYGDDEAPDGSQSPDWECWLVTRDIGARAHHMLLQFPRPGIDRAAAENIVNKVLNGLNEGSGQ